METKGKTMNLETYLDLNNREVGDLVNLFSVGCVLDKVNGDTFPMMVDNTIDFDDPFNLMDMDISYDSEEWYESLAWGEKGIVDEVMDELSYQQLKFNTSMLKFVAYLKEKA